MFSEQRPKIKKIYLVGSLRNPQVPVLAARLRKEGFIVFDDWFAAGPEADDYWQKYEQSRGRSMGDALAGLAADHVYHFDKKHLDECDAVILQMPAGKSGHLEFGYCIGQGKKGFVLFEKEPERWDVMYSFATKVLYAESALIKELSGWS